jgi:hypothetical protein
MNLKENSVNINIWSVSVIATTSPIIVPINPEAVMSETAS